MHTLNARLNGHRSDYRAGNGCSSRELLKLGVCDAEIELLEEIEIEDPRKDPKRYCCEQKWMDCTKNTCNINRADGFNKKYRKEYYQAYYQKNKERIKEYQQKNKNKERIKEYYQENRERLREHAYEKVPCECGSVVSRRHLAAHRRTKRHLDSKPKLIKINIKRKSVE